MIPTIETICEDLRAGTITVAQAVTWLHQHAEGTETDLRDAFALQAMTGYLSASWYTNDHKKLADSSYAAADAMLRARSKR